MQFGIREICDVVFKAKSAGSIGDYQYVAGQPVLYIDTAKTSTMEGAATTVYAQGGRGNSRLLTWEGEKTLTFTVEDALLSELGFAILSGAGLFKASENNKVYIHKNARAEIGADGVINLKEALDGEETISAKSPIFVMSTNHGSFGEKLDGFAVGTEVDADNDLEANKYLSNASIIGTGAGKITSGSIVFVDFYVEKTSGVTELIIDAENFAGYYYVEASTLFKRQSDGKDLPAELVFPNVKVQSNFTFSMASTGDPSTFTFTMDAMPGYTRFDKTKKVLCAMNIIDPGAGTPEATNKDSTATNAADPEATYPLA